MYFDLHVYIIDCTKGRGVRITSVGSHERIRGLLKYMRYTN